MIVDLGRMKTRSIRRQAPVFPRQPGAAAHVQAYADCIDAFVRSDQWEWGGFSHDDAFKQCRGVWRQFLPGRRPPQF
jgi:hypothetical protein